MLVMMYENCTSALTYPACIWLTMVAAVMYINCQLRFPFYRQIPEAAVTFQVWITYIACRMHAFNLNSHSFSPLDQPFVTATHACTI